MEDKDAILEAVMRTGMKDILVGAMCDVGNVDDEWLVVLKQRNAIRPTFTIFSNLIDLDPEKKPRFSKTPAGIDAAIRYGIQNIVIEVDLAWSNSPYTPQLEFPEYLNLCR